MFLSSDFNADNAGCLSTSEVKFLLEERDHQPDNPCVHLRRRRAPPADSSLSPSRSVFKKTLEYVTTFSRFHDQATNSKVRECAPPVPPLCAGAFD